MRVCSLLLLSLLLSSLFCFSVSPPLSSLSICLFTLSLSLPAWQARNRILRYDDGRKRDRERRKGPWRREGSPHLTLSLSPYTPCAFPLNLRLLLLLLPLSLSLSLSVVLPLFLLLSRLLSVKFVRTKESFSPVRARACVCFLLVQCRKGRQ